MKEHRWDWRPIRTFAAAVFLVLLITSCIKEATWTWTGEVAADQATADAEGELTPSDGTVDSDPGDLPREDTDSSVPKDTTETIEPTDTDIVEPTDTDAIVPDTKDVLPGSPVLVVAIPAVFSGESSGGPWTLRLGGPGAATAGQPSVGGPWTLHGSAHEGGSDDE